MYIHYACGCLTLLWNLYNVNTAMLSNDFEDPPVSSPYLHRLCVLNCL